MNLFDIFVIIIVALSAYLGFRKGAIRGFIQLIGLLAIVVISYQFRTALGNFFIKILPCFSFKGYPDVRAVNLLMYQGIAFTIIFVILYCLLNILINLSGMLDLVSKYAVMFDLANKIVGIIVGALEGLLFAFIVGFVMIQLAPTAGLVMESKFGRPIIERTPVATDVFAWTIRSSENQYFALEDYKKGEKTALETNLAIVTNLISCDVVKASIIQPQITNGKLMMDNVTVA